jgi:hypothetical protein
MMAGDWIKFRVKLVTDGRVRAMARATKQKPATIIGGLLMLWSIADEHADDHGLLPGYTFEDIDDITGVKGFAVAMPPDWIESEEGSIRLPNYQEHNGSTAKNRAESAKRMARSRNKGSENVALESNKVVTEDKQDRTKGVPREEKRREEEIQTTSGAGASGQPKHGQTEFITTVGFTLPSPLCDSPVVMAKAREFIETCNAKGHPRTPGQWRRIVADLLVTPDAADRMLEHSIVRGLYTVDPIGVIEAKEAEITKRNTSRNGNGRSGNRGTNAEYRQPDDDPNEGRKPLTEAELAALRAESPHPAFAE